MKILFVGDIVGRPGRSCLARWLPRLRAEYALDFVAVNGENAAGGLGATPEVLAELTAMGVHAITLGNHTWRKRDVAKAMDDMPHLVRPANYPPGVPGQGSTFFARPDGRKVGVVNLVGRVFLDAFDCPFRKAVEEIESLRPFTPIILVDFHAEATSEKVALGWHLDGRCSAVLGSHTHVQTADDRVLPNGTAYITDMGMTGPMNSVIGVDTDRAIRKFLTGMPSQFQVAKGPAMVCGVVLEIEDDTGRALSIERVMRIEEN